MLEEYYTNDNEDGRLNKDNVHKIEYRTTIHFLLKHLPNGSTVLDCCAGTGVYAFPLAEKGYKLTAGDLVQKHLNIMNDSPKRDLLQDVYKGNVLDMSRFADESFDAVICLGALYHLHSEKSREKCIDECMRITKKGGVFIFAYINRNAVFINHYKQYPFRVEENENIMKTGNNGIFYGMDFGEVDKLTKRNDLEKITDIGTDGLIYPLYYELNSLTEGQFENYMKYHLATCEQPSIIGHSMHGLWIGRKK
jgi:ubiquinone/menaquinone biosynthesis C-methylase UbiE